MAIHFMCFVQNKVTMSGCFILVLFLYKSLRRNKNIPDQQNIQRHHIRTTKLTDRSSKYSPGKRNLFKAALKLHHV